MTLGGWIGMIASVVAVTGLLAWCFYKVWTTPHETEHLRSPSDPTPDAREDGAA